MLIGNVFHVFCSLYFSSPLIYQRFFCIDGQVKRWNKELFCRATNLGESRSACMLKGLSTDYHSTVLFIKENKIFMIGIQTNVFLVFEWIYIFVVSVIIIESDSRQKARLIFEKNETFLSTESKLRKKICSLWNNVTSWKNLRIKKSRDSG